ncbi:MAG: TRAP transporter fused permease subunit [Deltaproteobacteria bacterium]|nr:TRAP transporter fused permease subunit [Deltaproteobacteria bacterium]
MRSLGRGWMIPVSMLAIVAGLFHYYTSGFGSPEPRVFRGLHLAFLLPVIFLFYPARSGSPKDRPSYPDIAAALLCVAATLYTVFHADRLNERFVGYHEVRAEEVFLGGLLALAVIEACRRALSKWFAFTVGIVLVYLFTCEYWPGLFHFKAFSLDRAVEILYLPNDDGIFGFLTGISAEILYIYILFAAVLTVTGAGNFLIEFSTWAAGWARGGSAKISVVSSALYGTVSGSTVANVYATGSFTIPMMKRSGYSPKEAAAVEAISGVGGQIMPPIMGAGSFIMAEVTGVPYFTIIKTAVIPAILYYLGVMCMVHFIAVRRGIQPLTKDERPDPRALLRHAYFVVPFVVIVYLLATGYSPSKAAFHTIWVTLILSCFDRKTWLDRRKILDIFLKSLISCALIASVLAGAGMIVGVLTRTGVALSFGTILVSASKGVLLLAMLFIFAIVSVLGTGIPTTAAYVIGVTVGAQALTNFNVELLAAHLFVFYYSVLADLTPPDAVTSFAAANLAGSEPMATGIEGFRLGIAGFLVPFAFVYQPALLLKGTFLETAFVFIITAIGVFCLACGVIGQFRRPLNWIHRSLFMAGAALLVFPGKGTMAAGLILTGTAGVWSWRGKGSQAEKGAFE